MSEYREIVARPQLRPLYFGMFGLSFLLVLYVQQVLHYSALWAAVVLLPISVMLLFAERFGRLIEKALHVPKPRKKTKPPRASKEARLQSKKRRSQTKQQRRDPGDE